MPQAPDLSSHALDNRYELHELIGEGAFGRVYRGVDRRLARPVAVKVIKPWWSEDPDWVRVLEREAQLLARVNDPGIVQIFDVGHAPEGMYYVAELVDGGSLAQRIGRGALPPWEACELATQLCSALGQAHSHGLVHRDVKPANVLISAGGRLKVGDFGVALLAEGSSDGAVTVVGTPRYMAPEQAQGRLPTPATDIYSVGVVLYEMLCGHPPFSGGTSVELALKHLNEPPPALPSTVPAGLGRIALRAMNKRPADRYATAALMGDALARAARAETDQRNVRLRLSQGEERGRGARPRRAGGPESGGSPPPARTRVAPRLHPRRNVNPAARRRATALLAVAILIIVGMTAGGVLLTRPSKAATPAVKVPRVSGQTSVNARTILNSIGLGVRTIAVPAPGLAPGTVTGQVPAAATALAPGSRVKLYVAEVPRWRPITSFAGDAAGQSVPFSIRGTRWRIVYSMGYQGSCTFIFWCSGPSSRVSSLRGGGPTSQFGLSEGQNQIRDLRTGAGIYRVMVSPGDDTARWSMQIEDYY